MNTPEDLVVWASVGCITQETGEPSLPIWPCCKRIKSPRNMPLASVVPGNVFSICIKTKRVKMLGSIPENQNAATCKASTMCSLSLNQSDQRWSEGPLPEVPGLRWPATAAQPVRVLKADPCRPLEGSVITVTLVCVVSSPRGPPRQ